MITLKNKTDCCGCEACVQICPNKCIQMSPDNEGFVYPLINYNKCIKCGQCEDVCPMNNNLLLTKEKDVPVAFGGYHKDEKVLYESSSGGAFSLFADYILSKNGAVCSCTLNSNNEANHIFVENDSILTNFRGSKYVQSRIGFCYKEIKKRLQENQEVLFIGTPCQTAGLFTYLKGKKYDNLLLMDFICHGVPSPLIFKEYIHSEEKKMNSKIIKFKFRNKDKGWNQNGLQLGTFIEFENGSKKRKYPAFNDCYMNAFSIDICLRQSCYKCNFKKIPKIYSDITIADFWGVGKISSRINNKKGTSLILLNTLKGKNIWENVNENFVYEEVDFEKAISRNKCLVKNSKLNKNRNIFFDDYNKKGFDFCKRKYMNLFVWLMYKIKTILSNYYSKQ